MKEGSDGLGLTNPRTTTLLSQPFTQGESSQSPRRAQPAGLEKTMHLPHGGHIGRFSGLPEESTEAKEWSEKDVFRPKTDNRTQDWHRIVQAQDALNTANEVIIPVAENYDTNTLLDFILTAWVILVQRYQRDEFYHFTWGFEHDVAQHSQCISAADIEFQSRRVGADVKSTIRSLRSKDIPVPQSNFFFNNGTEEEVSCCKFN